MRSFIRTAVVVVGATLAIGLISSMASAGANVAIGAGSFTANPGFVANAIDPITNPAIGASGKVHVVVNGDDPGKTIVTLHVEGLPANRSFGSHLHRDNCATTTFGGPHYQVPDPVNPVTANADAQHEVWLDFSTNASGRGRSQAAVSFQVLSGMRSVMIHQGEHTLVGGGAGQRLACLDLTI